MRCRQRPVLNLLYPENNTLAIHDEQDKYQVTLTIDL